MAGEGEDVCDAANVIGVPVGEDDVGDCDIAFIFQGLLEGGFPFGPAFAGVQEEALGACAYQVGVCALECEFGGIVAEDAGDPG